MQRHKSSKLIEKVFFKICKKFLLENGSKGWFSVSAINVLNTIDNEGIGSLRLKVLKIHLIAIWHSEHISAHSIR